MANTKIGFNATETGYAVTKKYIDTAMSNEIKAERNDWTKEEIKHLIKTNDNFVIKSLIRLYNYQTEDEKNTGETENNNNVGFNGYDAKPLTDLVNQIVKFKFVTFGQVAFIRNKLYKYSNQIAKIANGVI